MEKPVAAIARMRSIAWAAGSQRYYDQCAILAYLDKNITGDTLKEYYESGYASGVKDTEAKWPAELTRERLEELATELRDHAFRRHADALRALAAIAPERKKRVVNLWRDLNGHLHEREVNREPEKSWRPAARNVELED